jgi:tetratricopeptide (TPR) repeat protein
MRYFKLSTLLFIVLTTACNVKNTMPGPEAKIDESALKKIAATAYDNEAWKDVIRYYKQLTKKFPNNAESWYRIGNAYTQLNQTRFAVDAYQKALAIDSSNSKILHNMGVVQLQESTRTFIDLKNQTQPNDPLYIRAQLVINAIANLFYKEFEIEMEN